MRHVIGYNRQTRYKSISPKRRVSFVLFSWSGTKDQLSMLLLNLKAKGHFITEDTVTFETLARDVNLAHTGETTKVEISI